MHTNTIENVQYCLAEAVKKALGRYPKFSKHVFVQFILSF